MIPAPAAPRPLFISGPAGPLFAVYHAPVDGGPVAPHLVHVPAFAEEMNKARRTVALGAQALARAGIGVLILDLYGTGDSGGDFADARWEIWRGDVTAALAWVARQTQGPIGLWGLRVGCLLCADLVRMPDSPVSRLLLWQPVVSGNAYLTQFLRLRVAAGLMGRGTGESVAGLRAELAAGRSVEVAGYELAPGLASALEGASLKPLMPPADCLVDWIEVGGDGEPALPPASAQVVSAWRDEGVAVEVARVPGEPFWTTQEIATAPSLVDRTVAGFEARPFKAKA